MITKDDANFYKKTIGRNYAQRILDFFKSVGFFRPSGDEFSKQDIYNFFDLSRYDVQFHLKVLDCVEHYAELSKKVQERTQAIKEKSEAATSDSV